MSINEEFNSIKGRLDEESRAYVSVALFGQPGAGKSSLINSLVGTKVVETGVETDKTTEDKKVEHNGLYFWDLPGYGTEKFPADDAYLEKFKILEKDMFLCVLNGKLRQSDVNFFKKINGLGRPCIFVVTCSDSLYEEGVSDDDLRERRCKDIAKQVGLDVQDLQIIFVSNRNKEGLDDLQDAISAKLHASKRDRWYRSAMAYSQEFLTRKKSACEKYVAAAAGTSALNGINPVPGLNVAVDVATLLTLFKVIKDDFGLDDEYLLHMKSSKTATISQISNQLISWATKDGILLLLKRYAAEETVKAVSAYVPFVGQAIAASAGFLITSNAGKAYLDDCYGLAKIRLESLMPVA